MSNILKIILVFALLSSPVYAQKTKKESETRKNPITYSGKSTLKTDHFVFLYLNQTGNRVVLSYLDTGPGGQKIPLPITPKKSSTKKSIRIHKIGKKDFSSNSVTLPGWAHWNTNDGKKSHVLKEIELPKGYVIRPETTKGISYGEGCETMTFSGVDGTVALCNAGHVQTVTIEWSFKAYLK